MERNKKFTEASISNEDYIELFTEIKQCGMRAWDKRSEEEKQKKTVIIIEHSQYPSYTVLDFKNLYKYLIKLLGGDKRRKIDFVDAINNSGISSTTFRQGQSRNISSDNVKTGLEAAAEFFDIPLIQLLADFLVDCEDDSKKIRLSAHARYEKTIKSFIREAPELVAQLEAESAQTSTQETQGQPPEQTIPETKYRIERVKDEKKWLNPNNFDALPLVGRKKEIELLDNFIKSDGQFKIWAIAGPSGSGKTRLAYEWAYDSEVLKDWDRRVLHKEDLSTPKKWENWSPDRPTLIIIDYLYGFEKIVLELMNRRSMLTEHKIRLLLIDHIFSKPLYIDKRWGFSGDQESFDRNEKFFYYHKPLDLEQTENQEVIIKSIIAERVGIDIESNLIGEAHNYLLNTEGAYRPLFAALIADAINSGKDFKVWNRRELINYYLSGEKRLPWEHEDLALNGRLASHFLAAATARGGMHYSDLIEATKNCSPIPEYSGDVQKICQKVITNNDEITLAPFEPDILGESFFLKFLQFINNPINKKYKNEFQQIFMAGDEATQIRDAKEFIAFIQRLTRNLLNDDQSQSETVALWQTFFDFMCPSNFGNAEPIRWALTVGLIDIVATLNGRFPEELLVTLLNQAEPDVLYHPHDSTLLHSSVLYSMRYYEVKSKLTKIKPEFSKEMFALFDRYTKRGGITSLEVAIWHEFNEIIDALIARETDFEEILIGYRFTELLYAIKGNYTEVARRLIRAAGEKIDATNRHGHTALIRFCISGDVDIVKLLIDEGANIEATDNNGFTALIWASIEGHIDLVKLLLDKGTDIHAAENLVFSVFFWSSIGDHIDVAKLLIDGGGVDIHTADYEGFTKLMWASQNGYIDLVKLLLDKGADIHAADNKGFTALIWSCKNGHVDVAKLLIAEGANIHAADNEGFAALIWATIYGHVDVAKLLIDKGADIHAADNIGYTALIRACINGHVGMAKLLIDKGANIDAIDNGGRTALIWTGINGNVSIAKLLINEGADIHATDRRGHTALAWASRNGHSDVAKLLD